AHQPHRCVGGRLAQAGAQKGVVEQGGVGGGGHRTGAQLDRNMDSVSATDYGQRFSQTDGLTCQADKPDPGMERRPAFKGVCSPVGLMIRFTTSSVASINLGIVPPHTETSP
ncbi:MAG: hypothetical protein RL424_1071, partial [Pseudomonadota bacterium]